MKHKFTCSAEQAEKLMEYARSIDVALSLDARYYLGNLPESTMNILVDSIMTKCDIHIARPVIALLHPELGFEGIDLMKDYKYYPLIRDKLVPIEDVFDAYLVVTNGEFIDAINDVIHDVPEGTVRRLADKFVTTIRICMVMPWLHECNPNVYPVGIDFVNDLPAV